MRAILVLLLAALVGGCGGCASLPPSKASYRAATRLEFPGGGVCSATAVGTHTLISAAHCFDAKTGFVQVNASFAEYEIVADDGKDHVLVRVSSTLYQTATIGRPPKWGQMLSLIGNPLGLYSMLRMGRVAGWEKNGACPDRSRGCKWMLTNLNTVGGDSGGGYFNARGEVVAVHSGSIEYGAWRLAYSYPLAFSDAQLREIQ